MNRHKRMVKAGKELIVSRVRGVLNMNKSGQFFLIAALVIIVIIIGLSSLQVSTKVSKENTRIIELKNEIDLEGKSVVDHGVFVGKSQEQIQAHITELMEYWTETNPGTDITIVFGDADGYTIIKNVEVDMGGDTSVGSVDYVKNQVVVEKGLCPPEAASCEVNIVVAEGVEIPVTINEDMPNFYVVVAEENEFTGERTIVASESIAP